VVGAGTAEGSVRMDVHSTMLKQRQMTPPRGIVLAVAASLALYRNSALAEKLVPGVDQPCQGP